MILFWSGRQLGFVGVRGVRLAQTLACSSFEALQSLGAQPPAWGTSYRMPQEPYPAPLEVTVSGLKGLRAVRCMIMGTARRSLPATVKQCYLLCPK